MTVVVGQPVPRFRAPATKNRLIDSDLLAGWNVVIYFYPKDGTSGCTREAEDFRDLHDAFKQSGTVVIGVSRDSLQSHEKFRSKHALPFPLASDTDESLCTIFGVIRMKNLYGRQVRGIERSTFLIDGKGILRREWRGARVDGHARDVLSAAEALGGRA